MFLVVLVMHYFCFISVSKSPGTVKWLSWAVYLGTCNNTCLWRSLWRNLFLQTHFNCTESQRRSRVFIHYSNDQSLFRMFSSLWRKIKVFRIRLGLESTAADELLIDLRSPVVGFCVYRSLNSRKSSSHTQLFSWNELLGVNVGVGVILRAHASVLSWQHMALLWRDSVCLSAEMWINELISEVSHSSSSIQLISDEHWPQKGYRGLWRTVLCSESPHSSKTIVCFFLQGLVVDWYNTDFIWLDSGQNPTCAFQISTMWNPVKNRGETVRDLVSCSRKSYLFGRIIRVRAK